MNRWRSILDLFAWKRRWAVYDRYAYIWETMVYKPQPIVLDRERTAYGDLFPMSRYTYTGIVTSPAVVNVATLSTQ